MITLKDFMNDRTIFKYKTEGICPSMILIKLDEKGPFIKDVGFVGGGCSGNLQGISKLLVGKQVSEVVAMMEGIKCGSKKTSCPDQIAKACISALNEYIENKRR